MKIAIAQSRPIVGPVDNNLAGHRALIDLALENGAGLVVFPELSLTGYEPRLAASLARKPGDKCFAGLQEISNQHRISIVVGVPTVGDKLPLISTLLFRPEQPRQIYSK